MTRRRSSPLGLELVMSVVLALVVLPLLSHGAPVQDAHHADLQKYSEGCYYNYNHYSEGDRILTNEPCLNCTCHNKMLMCYLRVCPFTKPIGHDCTVEKREDQCCPIITCPEVPVDVSHNSNQLTTNAPGTELSIPEKYGCNIDSKFYPEGAQLPSNPNKPCELCYCIRNRTSCLMQECTLHIDGCQPIYNKGSCCPVRYNCDHENELLELEDFSTTTTTVRPTPGYVLSSTTSPMVTTDCVHNNEVYADGASITGKNACEHCYCMRGDIVCAVQECEMPTLESGAKTCRALPPAAGECCPSNYVCDDDAATTEPTLIEEALTTLAPKVQGDLHGSVSQEDVQLQEHIDDTEVPEQSSGDDHTLETTVAPIIGDIVEPSTVEDKKSQEEEESPLITTVSTIKETSYETTQSPFEPSTIHKTEGGLEDSHIIIDQDKEYDSTQAPIEDEIITEDKETEISKDVTTVAPAVEEELKKEEVEVPSKEGTVVPSLDESTTTSAESSEEETEKDVATTAAPIDLSKPSIEKDVTSIIDEQKPAVAVDTTTIAPSEKEDEVSATKAPSMAGITPEVSEASVEEELPSATDASAPSKTHIVPDEGESSSESAEPSEEASIDQDKIDEDIVEPSTESTTVPSVYEMVTQGEDGDVVMPEIGDHKTDILDHEKKPKDEAEIPQIGEEEGLTTSRPLPTEGGLQPQLPEVAPYDIKTEGTTIAPTQESASQPGVESVESEETSTETQDLEDVITSRPTIVKEESRPDESTEGSAEGVQKPIEEEEDIPAVVQEISKPISEAIPKGEEETKYQTTVLPVKESGVEESQEEETSSEEGEVQSTESSVGHIQKEVEGATTGLPVGIATDSETPIDQEEEAVKGKPEQGIIDSTTISSSIAAAGKPSTEEEEIKKQPEQGIADSTTTAPSIAGAEEEAVKAQSEEDLDSATIASSVADSEEPSSEEEEVKGKPQPGSPDYTTIAPANADSVASTDEEDVKGKPQQGYDSTTIAPSVASSDEPTTEEEELKRQEEQGISDSTSVAPSVTSSEEPSSEEKEVKGKPELGISEATTITPSVAGAEQPSSEEEEEVKGQPDQGISAATTIAPSVAEQPTAEKEEVKGQPEKDISESATIAPSIPEEPSSEEEEVKGQPDISEITTIVPTIADTKVPSVQEEEIKKPSELGIHESTTIIPHIADSEEPSSEEEGIVGQPELGILDRTTIAPSIEGSKVQSAKEEEIKGQPEEDISDHTTIVPSVAGSEEEIKGQSEEGIPDSTTTSPSVAGSEGPSSEEEEVKGQPEEDISDRTTIVPSVAGTEEEIKGQPEKDIPDSTTTSPSVAGSEEPSSEEEEVKGQPEEDISDRTTIAPHIAGPEEEIKGQPEKGIPDSTTTAPSVAGSEEPSSEEEEVKGQPEEDISDRTTIAPSIAGSEGEIKGQPEKGIPDSTTTSPSAADSEQTSVEDEEVKGQPEKDITGATTIAPPFVDSKIPSAEEEEEVKGKPEQGVLDSTTIASSLDDSEVPSHEEEEVKKQPEQAITDSTTPAAIEFEQPSEAIDDDQQAGQEDIHRTTVPPIASSDDESSEVVEAAEGSGEQVHEIIPSAIPGEGDCLVEDKTFANNASVPTSNECELSCSCVSSIVVCQRVQCSEPPEPNNCVLDEASADRCCPQYICGVDSFDEDQRPSTPQDIEDEEIQFTTLPPAKKYPEVSVEAEIEGQKPVESVATTVATIAESDEATSEEQEPIKPLQEDIEQTTSSKEESAKTEQPGLSDEISTPSSVDIELPVVKPDGPMSHVKDDADQEESSAEGSGEEDASTERPKTSDEKIKPLPSQPAKPVPEVTGAIEEGVPSKKPSTVEESTTLKAADEAGEESATVAPLGQGVSGIDDSVTVDSQAELGKPAVTQEEEISTESAVVAGAPKIDESIFATEGVLKGESSTIRPIESETGSEAPSLSSVLEGLDSAQSEETSEAPDQSSGESGEESTESEEDIKLPERHVTTVSPIASEQSTIKTIHTDLAGEIVPTESTTTIPEGDYQKPEMPEDLSHTKVDVESPLGTEIKKPVEPIRAEESDQSGVSEESTEKISEGVPPLNVPVSIILTPVEPSDKDQQKVDTVPEISQKKDEFPAAEGTIPEKEKPLDQSTEQVPVEEGKPLSSTLAPATSEEELLSGTVAPTPAADSEVEKEEIAGQTSTPSSEDQQLAGAVSPVSEVESEEEKDKIASQTITPTIGEQPIAVTVAPDSGDVSGVEKGETQTSAPAVEEQSTAGTIAPVLGGALEKEKKEPAGQTSEEEQPLPGTVVPTSGEESEEEIASQTTVPASVGKPTVASEEEKEDIASQTSAPAFVGELLPSTIAPGAESEEQKKKISGIEEELLPGTVAPGLVEGSEEEKEGIASQTSAPVPVTEGLEEEQEEISSQTGAPTTVGKPISGTVAPDSAEESEEEKEEVAGQTSAPTISGEPLPGTVAPDSAEDSEEEKEEVTGQTSAPTIVGESLPGIVTPSSAEESEEEKEAIASQTTSPASVTGEKSEEEKEEIASQTSAPVIVGKPISGTVAPDSAEESEEEKQEVASQTSSPAISGEPLPGTVAPDSAEESEEEKDEVTGQTSAPTIVGESLPGTVAPDSAEESEEDKEEVTSAPTIVGESLPGTVAPGSAEGSEEEKEGIVSQTSAPAHATVEESEEEKVEIASQTSAPSIADESLPGTIAPATAEESEEEKEVIATQTSAPAESSTGSIAPSSEEGEEEIVSETARPTAEDKYPGATLPEDKKPSVQIPLEAQEKDITTISTPVRDTEEEALGVTEAPAVFIPVKAVETSDEKLSGTEAPAISIEKEDEGIEEVSSSTQASIPAVEKDESLEGTQPPALSEESATPSTVPVSETEEEMEEGSAEMPVPVTADVSPVKADRGSEEELEPEISTEEALSIIEGSGSDDKQPIDKTLLQTETPLPVGETVRPLEEKLGQPGEPAEDEKPISITDAAVISEVTPQPDKPDSGDQIAVDKQTVEPSADSIPAQTESSVDEKAPEVTEAPIKSDEILVRTEKPVSVAVLEKDNETSVSVEEPSSEEAIDQTERPTSAPSVPQKEEEILTQTAKPDSIAHEIPSQTEQPISLEGPVAPVSDDQQVIKDTTDKSTEDTSALESEEEREKEGVSTIAPATSLPSASEVPIAPAAPESSAAEEESEQTEAPKDDVKIQTIAEFVTERVEEQTTILPIQDAKKEQIPELPLVASSEEAATSSEEGEEPDVSIATEKVVPIPSTEESEEKILAPEIPSEISEEDQKSEERPTESVIPAPTTEQPIVPVKDKFDAGLPKPIATDEEISEEEEASLPTTVHPLFPHIGLDQATFRPAQPNASDKIDDVSESTARPPFVSSSTLTPTTEQPITSAPPSHQAPTYGHVPPQYPSYAEDEYTDEDEAEVFGPGTCRYGGKLFVSAQQIPRDDPCDFCFCFRSDIICLQQSCPPPISGCHEEPISGFCCPRYECPVSMATVLNITTSTTTTSTTLPPHFLHHAYRGAAEKNGCHISGKSYRVGDKIDSASGPCMHCTCGGDGQMKCDPKTCSPEPMLRQMIAVVASRRR